MASYPPLFWSVVLQLWLPSAAIILFVMVAMGLLVVRLNRSHARLRASLETELAVRKKAEEALRESEVFYHTLVENLPQSILRKDLDGRFTFVNQRMSSSLGKTLDEIRGKTDFDFFPAELAEKYRRDDARVVASNTQFETIEEHVTPGGEKLYVHVIKTPLYDASEKIIGIQGIFWDVTARKRAEERLQEQNLQLAEMAENERRTNIQLKQTQSRMIQSERLAGLGQMVAGVAHEINNPLSFVNNNVAVLQRDVGEMRDLLILYRQAEAVLAEHAIELHDRIRDFEQRIDIDYTLDNLLGLLRRTREGLHRIQQIVKDLRLFARLDESDLNEVNLNAGIESTVNIIQGHAKKKRIQLELDLAPLPDVTCYPAKINQVVMNLITNAIDACCEGDTVRVSTRADDDSVCIQVSDTGAGIDPAIRDRIFDPFFTTKPIGSGTGLGLSISYGIVQDHGGTIEVDSTPGRGTRFTVHLPIRPAARHEPVAIPASQVTSGGLRVEG